MGEISSNINFGTFIPAVNLPLALNVCFKLQGVIYHTGMEQAGCPLHDLYDLILLWKYYSHMTVQHVQFCLNSTSQSCFCPSVYLWFLAKSLCLKVEAGQLYECNSWACSIIRNFHAILILKAALAQEYLGKPSDSNQSRLYTALYCIQKKNSLKLLHKEETINQFCTETQPSYLGTSLSQMAKKKNRLVFSGQNTCPM